jgi:hypothetical protein
MSPDSTPSLSRRTRLTLPEAWARRVERPSSGRMPVLCGMVTVKPPRLRILPSASSIRGSRSPPPSNGSHTALAPTAAKTWLMTAVARSWRIGSPIVP